MKFSRSTACLLAILALGTGLRLLWIYYVNTQPVYDFKRYHDLAMSLLQTGRYTLPEGLDYIKSNTLYIQTGVHYPTAFRPPGYPFFLAAVYALHPSILAAKLANVGLSTVWMVCMYLLGSRFFSERIGLWAAFLTAIFPPAISYTSVISTEILSAALLLVILCIHFYRIGRPWVRHPVLGCLMGFLSLVKPYFIVLPAIYGLLVWWQQREQDAAATIRRRIVRIAVPVLTVTLTMAAVISPWTIRNYLVFHRFVPISTNGDFVLYINNNDLSQGIYMDVMKVPNSIFKTDRILNEQGEYNEADAMKLARQEAIRWIRLHPDKFVLLGLTRLAVSYLNVGAEIWEWTMSQAQLRFDPVWIQPLIQAERVSGLVVVGGGAFYSLVVLFNLLRRQKMNQLHVINLLFVAFFTMVIFASEGQPRYMFVMFPFFLLGIAWMGARMSAALTND
ncbi:ArnT family glycosyltransferase [Effusibacillus pohliae]|uniref:ArnT family glycosyltransferase n=1 Tax=Effusibacillus pohliae TaxID=232270 RepID=UPI0003686C4D|nr:glycosyltransferase family 39 protein [Effusibacillus pohliae]